MESQVHRWHIQGRWRKNKQSPDVWGGPPRACHTARDTPWRHLRQRSTCLPPAAPWTCSREAGWARQGRKPPPRVLAWAGSPCSAGWQGPRTPSSACPSAKRGLGLRRGAWADSSRAGRHGDALGRLGGQDQRHAGWRRACPGNHRTPLNPGAPGVSSKTPQKTLSQRGQRPRAGQVQGSQDLEDGASCGQRAS